MHKPPLLQVCNLVVTFPTENGTVRAVDGVSFEIEESCRVGLVGESGCGKSALARSILRLIETPSGQVSADAIWFQGKNLMDCSEKTMRQIRGSVISMIFQDPLMSLNPIYTVGSQIIEVIRLHQPKTKLEAYHQAVEMLKLVKFDAPEQLMRTYPHQLSGGQLQRIMIAMALACKPKILIEDEPTTALDVITQSQVLDLLESIRQSNQMSLLLITHDLRIVADYTDEMIVMYAGRIVEQGSTSALFSQPHHPYTRILIESIPQWHQSPDECRKPLLSIQGGVPSLSSPPPGCWFASRCPLKVDTCTQREPPLIAIGNGRKTRCFRWEEAHV
ncbi:ABC transporter ATP-binding protein [Pajaroellobacter abortibovis]|uniref:ABC transporter domain-containing protein n=1 Tax=Pajaroellobacter abortibovis TaxID=1882918 RepID=A0A1L6MWS6_9BACT|nr:ABC transporter ATP-binding protein [Pajaroellobacter abortibovis]APS00010.1 hypothetical protein BCY86_04400 [Pajaroellobacter abortibovis]